MKHETRYWSYLRSLLSTLYNTAHQLFVCKSFRVGPLFACVTREVSLNFVSHIEKCFLPMPVFFTALKLLQKETAEGVLDE